jgi:hypothetical protein
MIIESLIPIFGVLMPVLLIWVIFYYNTESDKNKYNTIIEVSKNIKDSEEIKEILESLAERKKTSTDLRKTGLVTIFIGIGLVALDYFGLGTNIVFGVGLLVMFIGIGQMVAGYVYPNQPYEINKAVEGFEKE